jgi:hypothetical protein
MFIALFFSAPRGTAYTAIGMFCAYYVGWQLVGSTPTLIAAIRHNTYKNIPIAVYTMPTDDEQISA